MRRHVEAEQTDHRAAGGRPPRGRSSPPGGRADSGRDRSPHGRHAPDRERVGPAVTPRPPPARRPQEPSEVRSPAPPDAPAMGRGPRGPQARGYRRGIPDRAVDALPGPRADPEAMGRGLPGSLPLREAEVLGMESADSGSSGQGAGRGIGPGLVGEGLAPDQKKAGRRGAEIVFVDETGFSFRDGVATTWAPRGRTPVL